MSTTHTVTTHTVTTSQPRPTPSTHPDHPTPSLTIATPTQTVTLPTHQAAQVAALLAKTDYPVRLLVGSCQHDTCPPQVQVQIRLPDPDRWWTVPDCFAPNL